MIKHLSFIKQASGCPFQSLTQHTFCHRNKHPMRKMNTLLLASLFLLYLQEGEKHMHSTHMCKYKCLEEESYKKDLLRVTLCFDKNFCNAF
uniref:Prostate and testis expressed 4 n=1 Tax=Callithrix jacchus TaxID=9483 RepID=A0A8I3X7K7_CALJA